MVIDEYMYNAHSYDKCELNGAQVKICLKQRSSVTMWVGELLNSFGLEFENDHYVPISQKSASQNRLSISLSALKTNKKRALTWV